MTTPEMLDKEMYLNDNSENELKVAYINDNLLNFWSTLDIMGVGSSPIEQAEKIITDANKSIWVSEYLLENANKIWLWKSNYAQLLEKDIKNIKYECGNLETSMEKFQAYLKKTNGVIPSLWRWIQRWIQKFWKKVIWWNEGKIKYDIEYETILGELNAQVDKVNWMIEYSKQNQKLLESDIEKIENADK